MYSSENNRYLDLDQVAFACDNKTHHLIDLICMRRSISTFGLRLDPKQSEKKNINVIYNSRISHSLALDSSIKKTLFYITKHFITCQIRTEIRM